MKAERLITPGAFVLVTLLVVMIPAERSGWDFDGLVTSLTFFATTVAIYSLFCLGLNVQWGYTGVFNFGVAGFFLVGAYTAGFITKGDPPPPDPVTGRPYVEYIGGFGDELDFLPFLDSGEWLPFVVGTLVAAIAAGVLAFLLAIPTLRLRDDYLAITTIGIAEFLRSVIVQERGIGNGSRGLGGIAGPLEGLFEPGEYKYVFFAIAAGVLLLVFVALQRAIRSPWGRVLRALREDETATAASGKNVFMFKTQAFIVGAMIMGVGGAVFAYERSAISPDTFSPFSATFLFWAMVIVGGSGNNKGAILGAYMVYGFYFLSFQIQGYDLPAFLSTTRISAARDILIGSLIVTVLLLRPQGLMPEERRVSIWLERQTRRLARGRAPPEPAARAGPE